MAQYMQAQSGQDLVTRYRESRQPWPATAERIAIWDLNTEHWIPHRSRLIRICADQIAQAMREEYYRDPQGRRVRAKHVARVKRNGQQLYLWDDIRSADRAHMEISFQQRRQQIVGDCLQLKTDVNSYNENGKPTYAIQLVLDFTHDVEERETFDEVA
ncbi:MAG: hypothetical protein ACRERD_14305 [Candidatus Binatia bacterium]